MCIYALFMRAQCRRVRDARRTVARTLVDKVPVRLAVYCVPRQCRHRPCGDDSPPPPPTASSSAPSVTGVLSGTEMSQHALLMELWTVHVTTRRYFPFHNPRCINTASTQHAHAGFVLQEY